MLNIINYQTGNLRRFDELASDLKRFDAPLVIAVSEDATQIISRV